MTAAVMAASIRAPIGEAVCPCCRGRRSAGPVVEIDGMPARCTAPLGALRPRSCALCGACLQAKRCRSRHGALR
eukprot:365707-Chlamydomonas_euryale.AAC.21